MQLIVILNWPIISFLPTHVAIFSSIATGTGNAIWLHASLETFWLFISWIWKFCRILLNGYMMVRITLERMCDFHFTLRSFRWQIIKGTTCSAWKPNFQRLWKRLLLLFSFCTYVAHKLNAASCSSHFNLTASNDKFQITQLHMHRWISNIHIVVLYVLIWNTRTYRLELEGPRPTMRPSHTNVRR